MSIQNTANYYTELDITKSTERVSFKIFSAYIAKYHHDTKNDLIKKLIKNNNVNDVYFYLNIFHKKQDKKTLELKDYLKSLKQYDKNKIEGKSEIFLEGLKPTTQNFELTNIEKEALLEGIQDNEDYNLVKYQLDMEENISLCPSGIPNFNKKTIFNDSSYLYNKRMESFGEKIVYFKERINDSVFLPNIKSEFIQELIKFIKEDDNNNFYILNKIKDNISKFIAAEITTNNEYDGDFYINFIKIILENPKIGITSEMILSDINNRNIRFGKDITNRHIKKVTNFLNKYNTN